MLNCFRNSGSSLVRVFVGLNLLFFVGVNGLLAQVLEIGTPQEVGISGERLERLDRVIEEAISNEEIPGANVLVARKGKVVYRKSFGNRSLEPEKQPMTLDTVFDMASLTKVMATATSVMVLVEQGKLVLSRPVADYIPEFKIRRKDKITVLQLLTHFSGLRPDLDLRRNWTGYDKAIQLACNEVPIAKAGQRFIYSDINYFLLAEIVSRVSEMPFEEFLEKTVFGPLDMKETRFNPPEEWLNRVAPTEKRDGTMLLGRVHDPTASRMGGVAGHAGLFSTLSDTAAWGQMLLNLGVYNDFRVLSPLSVLKMTSPQTPYGEKDWRGLGFDIETRFSTTRGDLFPVGSFGHTGFTGTSVWIDPLSETLVVLLTSRLHPEGEGDVVALRSRVASVVAASIEDLPLDRSQYYYRY